MLKLARIIFISVLTLVLAVLFVLPSVRPLTAPAPARAETGSTQILYVNNQHPNASDDNPGTLESAPLETINRAISLATPGTKILIYPGIYREEVQIKNVSNTTDRPLVIEANQPGKTIVSGSDTFTGQWAEEGKPSLYSHPWLYDWGLAPYPDPYWEQVGVVLEPIVRRKEMVFVDGKLFRQELSKLDLKPGSFYVAEDENKVYVWLEDSSNITGHHAEAAVREKTLTVQNAQHIIIRGLVFQHSAHPVQGSSVDIADSSYITIENCHFDWNNWGGLSVASSNRITVKDNIANNNGAVGIGAWEVEDSLFENNTTNYNNWRGVRGEFTGWATAGFKALHIHRTLFKNQTAVGNQARGFWADTNFEDVTIENGVFTDNLREGIFLEALQGPVSVKNARVNKLNGIEAKNITLENNIIGNLYLSGASGLEGSPRQPLENWTLSNNIFYAINESFLIDVPGNDSFITTLKATKNLYFSAGQTDVFGFGKIPLDFKKWQDVTMQDLNSLWSDPKFQDPANNNFTLLPESPLHNKDVWPIRSLPPDHNRIELIRKYKMEAFDKILSHVTEKRSYYKDSEENLKVAQGIGVLVNLPEGRGLREDFKQGTFAIGLKVPQGGAMKQLLVAWRNESGGNLGDTYIFLIGGRASSGMGGANPPQPFSELEIRTESTSGNISLTASLDKYFHYDQWQDLVINWGSDGVTVYWNQEKILQSNKYTGPLFDARSPLIVIWDVYKYKQGEIEIKDVVLLDRVLSPAEVQQHLVNRTGRGQISPGDANGDGVVDETDLELLKQDYLGEPEHNTDFNSDGRVDIEDFAILQANYSN